MLSEIQAWEVLYAGFSRPSGNGPKSRAKHDGWAQIVEGYDPDECLCDSVNTLYLEARIIDDCVSKCMSKKITRYGPPDTIMYCPFYWPRNREGALQRAAFCAMILETLYTELYTWFGLTGVYDPYANWNI